MPIAAQRTAEVTCPFCRGPLPAEAVKCRHCGEWVRGKLKSPGVAGFLSFIWPGLGHVYLARYLMGIVLMVVAMPVIFGALAASLLRRPSEVEWSVVLLWCGAWGLVIWSAWWTACRRNAEIRTGDTRHAYDDR
jgi:hypothetical protein